MRRILASGAVLLGCALPASAVEIAPEIVEACHSTLPKQMRPAEADAREGSSSSGTWWIETAQMDGHGSAEAILVVLPEGERGEIHFFAEREGKDPLKKKIRLKSKSIVSAGVSFHEFAKDRALAHVDGADAGQVLLHWNGKDLEKVWEVGRSREDEKHWFNMEDLDGDGVFEVIAYIRRDLDLFYADEIDVEEGGGAARQLGGPVDAVAVYRLEDNQWKESKDLLESLR